LEADFAEWQAAALCCAALGWQPWSRSEIGHFAGSARPLFRTDNFYIPKWPTKRKQYRTLYKAVTCLGTKWSG